MLKLAIIGYPVQHSLSPVMHMAALRAMGIEGTYEAIEVLPENLGTFMQFAKRNLDGFNVTVPHKQTVIPYLNSTGTAALRSKSVNTVSCRNDCLTGVSTDGVGLEFGLREAFEYSSLDGLTIAFLGCGGAVQSVAHHLAMIGVKKIVLLNRTVEKAELLKAGLLSFPYGVTVEAAGLDSPLAAALLSDCDIAVQGTSLGLKSEDPLPFDPAVLNPRTFVYDMIYWETPFLKRCRACGLQSADGRGMLLHQGVAALAYWLNQPPPIEVMRDALDNALRLRGE